jgi:hypothetical protein
MNELRNYRNEFASMYKKAEKVANKTLEKTNNAFLKALEEAESAAGILALLKEKLR